MKKTTILFLILVIIAGFLIHYPHHNFQKYLSQGDHGRDLYSFKETSQGALPYKDYWWPYGPLMPYYYAFLYKLFGVNIQVVLVGQIAINILSGIFFYLALTVLIHPAAAAIATVYFWAYNTDFFYTYNHAGGIAALLCVIYFIFLYIRSQKRKYFYFGILSVVLLSLIKLNCGLFGLLAFLITLFLADFIIQSPHRKRNRYFYLSAAFIVIVFIGVIYWRFLCGLPLYIIRQCFPYLSVDQPYHFSFLSKLHSLWQYHTAVLPEWWSDIVFAMLIVLSTVQTFFLLFIARPFEKNFNNLLRSAIAALLIFSFLELHEFIASGVAYTIFWITPLKFMLVFIILWVGTCRLSVVIRGVLWVIILLIALLQIIGQHKFIMQMKNPYQYISDKKAGIYVGNSVQWLDTVGRTLDYLKTHLKKDESFLALPYDSLYYYLTDRKSPTRQIIFFNYLNMRPQQEEEIIARLEAGKINYVLLSNRCISSHSATGTLGVTYCRLLAGYIDKNFDTVAVFGNWQTKAEWAWGHGVKILKRIGSD